MNGTENMNIGWKNFGVLPGTKLERKLNEANSLHVQLAREASALIESIESSTVEVVALTAADSWGNRRVAKLGIFVSDGAAPDLESWVLSDGYRKSIFEGTPRSQFHQAQESLLKRYYMAPAPDFWVYQSREDENDNSSRAFLSVKTDEGQFFFYFPCAVNFQGRWVLQLPINPENGDFFRPRGVEDLGVVDEESKEWRAAPRLAVQTGRILGKLRKFPMRTV